MKDPEVAANAKSYGIVRARRLMDGRLCASGPNEETLRAAGIGQHKAALAGVSGCAGSARPGRLCPQRFKERASRHRPLRACLDHGGQRAFHPPQVADFCVDVGQVHDADVMHAAA